MATRTLTISHVCPPEPHRRDECAGCLRDRLLATPGVRARHAHATERQAAATADTARDARAGLRPAADAAAGARRRAPPRRRLLPVAARVGGARRRRDGLAAQRAADRGRAGEAARRRRQRQLRRRGRCASSSIGRSAPSPEIVRRLDALGLRVRAGRAAANAASRADGPQVDRVDARADPDAPQAGDGGDRRVAASSPPYLTHALDGPPTLRYALVAAGFVIAGWYTAIDTFHVLREFQFDIDVLMFAAAFGAAAAGALRGRRRCCWSCSRSAARAKSWRWTRRARRSRRWRSSRRRPPRVRDADGSETARARRGPEGRRPRRRPPVRPPARRRRRRDRRIRRSTSRRSPANRCRSRRSPARSVFAGTINGEGLLIVAVTQARPANRRWRRSCGWCRKRRRPSRRRRSSPTASSRCTCRSC